MADVQEMEMEKKMEEQIGGTNYLMLDQTAHL